MSRNLTSGMATAVTADRVMPVLFVEASFASGFLRVWSGIGAKSWNNLTWAGVGNLGSISEVSESATVEAQSVTLVLSGIPNDVLGDVLREIRQGHPCRIWLGMMDEADNIIVDPYCVLAGRIDVGAVEEHPETSIASITVEKQLVDMKRLRERRYSDQDQQFYFPGDLGFAYVSAIQQWNGVWGKAASVPSSGGGIGAGGGAGGGGRGGTPGRFGP